MLSTVHTWRRSALRTLLLATLAALSGACPAAAADSPIALVKSFSAGTLSSNAGPVVVAGGVGYVVADSTGRRGTTETGWSDLFRTDGTPEGTRLVKSFSYEQGDIAPTSLTAVGETVFLTTKNTTGERLWQSDGTEAGTVPVTLHPEPTDHVDIQIVGAHAGELIVMTTVESGPKAVALWAVAHGAPARKVWTMPAVTKSGGTGDALLLGDGRVAIDQGLGGNQLWIVDTAAGHAPPAGPVPGFGAAESISLLHSDDAKVYVTARTPDLGSELWVADGTEAGTKLVADLVTGPDSTAPSDVATVGNDVFLTSAAGDGLFRVRDGRATQMSVPSVVSRSEDPHFAVVGSRLCFTAGERPALWCTDPNGDGPTRVSPDLGADATVGAVEQLGEMLVFGLAGQVWQSDGTAAGTRPHGASLPGTAARDASGFASLGSRLLFSAADPAHGRELWRSDDAPGGTALLRDLATQPLDAPITPLPSIDGRAYFTTTDTSGAFGLWRSDGTTAGTELVRLLPAGTRTRTTSGIAVGGRMLFQLSDETLTPASPGKAAEPTVTTTLWQTDGTGPGTRQIVLPTDLVVDAGEPFTRVGSRLFFHGHTTGGKRVTLLAYDLATQRLTPLHAIHPGSRTDRTVVATRRAAYFQGYDRAHGRELWRTDGTAKGTWRVLDATPGSAGSAAPFAATSGRVFFATKSAAASPTRQLWSSSGSARSTRRVMKIWPTNDSDTSPAVSAVPGPGGRLLFTTLDHHGHTPTQLWSTDGTTRGTRSLANAVDDGRLEPGMALGKRFWFTAGGRLWSTNRSGTRAKRAGSPIQWLSASRFTRRGDTLFFTRGENELWRIDQSNQAPRVAQDLRPRTSRDHPADLMYTRTHLLFTEDDGTTGRQLFGVPLPG